MKASVRRVLIFGLALWAHPKPLHRGMNPVVRKRFDDAEARTAMGAVGEGIPVPPVLRIKNLGPAIRTGGTIRQDQGALGPLLLAGSDFESFMAHGIQPRAFQALDETARRFFRLQPAEEFLQAP